MGRVPAALSVDLEFFQHIPAVRGAAGTTGSDAVGSEGVRFLLEAFSDGNARGTFFAVSEIADSHPDLLADVVADGHELGSHTHTHRHLSDLSDGDRQAELADSRNRLEATAGVDVAGFRAPSFDVAEDHFAEVSAAGYGYDSSVVPSRRIPGWYGGEFRTRRPSSARAIEPDAPVGLAEVPVGVMPALKLPLSGTWLRFFGVRYTILGMSLLARRGIAPVLYVHPWELVDLPEIEGVPRRVYVRTGKYMRRAVERILATSFEFVTVGALADDVQTDTDHGRPDATEREGT